MKKKVSGDGDASIFSSRFFFRSLEVFNEEVRITLCANSDRICAIFLYG